MVNPYLPRIGAVLSLFLLSICCQAQDVQSLSAEQRQERLEELRSTIEQLKGELQEVQSARSDLMDDLEKSEKNVGELNQKVRKLKNELNDQQTNLRDLRREKEAQTLAKKQQQGSVAQHVNAAYRLGQQSTLKLLLNQQDPATVSRNFKYLNYVVAARATKIAGFNNTINRLNQLEPEIAAAVQSIEQKKQSLEQQHQALVSQQAERQRALKRMEALIADKDGSLQAKEKDREDLQKVLHRVAQAAKRFDQPSGQAFSERKGSMPWPTTGEVRHRFGSPRVQGKMSWQGMLIAAEEGSPVFAVHGGRVVFADYLRGQGLLIVIDHGSGFMSLYAHNQSLYRDIGDWVGQGDQIATVGVSGGRLSAGLYFELRHQGQPTDPQQWLTKT